MPTTLPLLATVAGTSSEAIPPATATTGFIDVAVLGPHTATTIDLAGINTVSAQISGNTVDTCNLKHRLAGIIRLIDAINYMKRHFKTVASPCVITHARAYA